jgi:Asp-tRNA(Asn)/Glu-tRNA(Gln) amidotransferase A subunit family amidase
MQQDFWASDATEMAKLVRHGKVSSEALMRSCLDRISECDGSVEAWEFLKPDLAISAARDRDTNPTRGALHGVPVAIKDLIDTANMPTTYGSPIYLENRPRRDAACVKRLLDAGAVIIGKTVTTEFATFRPGKTHNPHNPSHTPGGSSSGSAAAVASGMTPLALGTQTVGSIIRPAAFCGVFGFKATQGSLDLDGIKPLATELDSLGCFTRSIRDAVLWHSVMTNGMPAPKKIETPTPKVALIRTANWCDASEESRSTVLSAAEKLTNRGIAISEPKFPAAFDELAACQDIIFTRGAFTALRDEWSHHRDKISPQLAELLVRGEAISDRALANARKTADACRKILSNLFRSTDLILTPATRGEAPFGLTATGDPLFNRPWTLMLGPCATLPNSIGPNGLPVGIQLVGARNQDSKFLTDVARIADCLGLEGNIPPV